MTVAVVGTSSRPARTESERLRPPSAISRGLASSKASSSLAKRTVCDGWSTTTRPSTCGMPSSRRMGLPDGESKQFLLLGGEPILNHSVRRLLGMPQVDGLVVVLHPSHTVRFASELLAFDDAKPLLIAEGGRKRSDSVRAGLLEVPTAATVDRSGLWAVQTPQVFRAGALRDVYSRADLDGATDDATLLERGGYKVGLVASTPANVKITTPTDLPLAGALLTWEVEADV